MPKIFTTQQAYIALLQNLNTQQTNQIGVGLSAIQKQIVKGQWHNAICSMDAAFVYQANSKNQLQFAYFTHPEYHPEFDETTQTISSLFIKNDAHAARAWIRSLKKMNLKIFDKNIKRIHINVDPAHDFILRYLKRKKATYSGALTIGKIRDALKTLDTAGMAIKDLELRTANKKDIKAILKIEVLAHEAEASSRMTEAMNVSHIKYFYGEMIKSKDTAIALINNQVVGVISTPPFGTLSKSISVQSIVVDPDHQNQGIARALYRFALKQADAQGIKYFEGLSATKKILHLSKILSRKPISHSYFLDRSWLKTSSSPAKRRQIKP